MGGLGMFRKNKKNDSLNFKSKNYKMRDNYDSNNLVVANLAYVTNDDIPEEIYTDQKYIFEVVNIKGENRYIEIFTGFIMYADENIYFNLPYVVNIVPINEIIPKIKTTIPKYSLILLLNEVNKNNKQKAR